jgi:hypothetical protein
VKLRIGIVLWVASWIPYAIIFGFTGVMVPLTWAFEITIGIIGVALAGSEFGQAVKANGWRGAPRTAWNAFVHGQSVNAPAPESP